MQKYRALYRENRPEVFSEVVGQEHVVRVLRHQIATDTVNHAYLFCGTRGTGKTTTARLLAKAVNCTGAEGSDRPCGECENCRAIAEGRFMDVVELDAASNNGVENIRELRETVNYPPSVGRKRVFIIDEVHMLSNSAFNAFLKTLEEPPENVIFILATTDPDKLPQTVLSRCMRLDFHRVPASQIRENLSRVCEKHGVEITEQALSLLAANADGSVRDSLSLLDQCMSSGEKLLDRDLVLEFLGAVSEEFYLELTEKVLTHNVADAFLLLDRAITEGGDVRQLLKDWMAHYRSLMIAKYVRNPQDMLNLSEENIEQIRKQAARVDIDEINRSIVTLARTIQDARYSTQARILMEVAIVSIAGGLEYGAEPQERPAGVRKGRPAAAVPAQQPAAAEPRGAAEPLRAAEAAPAPIRQKPVQREAARAAGEEAEVLSEKRPEETPQQARTYDPDELADIWRDAFEEAEQIKPSMNAMRKAQLAAMNDREFKVIAESIFVKSRLESERQMIAELMERRTGRRMKMVVKLLDDMEQAEGKSAEEIAREASQLIGVNVEIR